MLQAHEGDFLVLENGDRRIIVDTGTSQCKAELARRLSTPGCELLIITHLDDDHFGGLHALATDALNGRIPDGTIHWPKKIWVNHFEASNTVARFAAGMHFDGPPLQLLDELKKAVDARRERGFSIQFGSAGRGKEAATTIVIEGDQELAQYLSPPEKPDFDEVRWPSDLHRFWHDVAHYSRFGVMELLQRRLGPSGKARAAAELRWVLHELEESDGPAEIRFIRSDAASPRITVNDRDLFDQIDGGTIPQGLSATTRGLLHQARNGAQIIERTKQALTFVEALRRLGIEIETVRGGSTNVIDGLTIEVIGPDSTDLDALEREWERVEQKSVVHINKRAFALGEATMFSAISGRFGLDRSVTNRSSIQCLAIASLGYALLTGDGRPDTLERADLKGRIPEGVPCCVFKVAHHGSPYNIRMKSPNAILAALVPENLWVSGKNVSGQEHPALNFLKLLDAEAAGSHKFSIAITNTNDSVDLFKTRLSIQIMNNGQPFTCSLG